MVPQCLGNFHGYSIQLLEGTFHKNDLSGVRVGPNGGVSKGEGGGSER